MLSFKKSSPFVETLENPENNEEIIYNRNDINEIIHKYYQNHFKNSDR